jgi:hypothetical protein
LIFHAPSLHVIPVNLGHAGDIADPRFDPMAVHGLVRAHAFDDFQINPVCIGKASPGGTGRLDRIDRINNHGKAQSQIFVRQGYRDVIGRDPGLIPRQSLRHIAASIGSIEKTGIDKARERPSASMLLPDPGSPASTISRCAAIGPAIPRPG